MESLGTGRRGVLEKEGLEVAVGDEPGEICKACFVDAGKGKVKGREVVGEIWGGLENGFKREARVGEFNVF